MSSQSTETTTHDDGQPGPPSLLAGPPRIVDAHGPAWRVRTVQVLHLGASFALALFFLVPASLLILSAAWIGFTVATPWAPNLQYEGIGALAVDLGLFVLALPVAATLTARLACRIQRDRLKNVFRMVETRPPDPLAGNSPWFTRVWRFVFGRDAWTMVVYCTAAGLHGLLASGLVVLLVVCGGAMALGAAISLALLLIQYSLGNIAATPSPGQSLVIVLCGSAAMLIGLRVTPRMVSTEVLIHRALLFDVPEVRVRRRLLHVQDSRLRMVDAAEAERRRIERDLHDGAQQRLLALTMTLARARSRVSADPDQALALITEAQQESKEVLDELRQVARGLHPRVLTDHGLNSALPVAAERAPVSVRVEVDLVERPSPRAEGVAYYVACEALNNVAKHAGAAHVTVAAQRIERSGREDRELLRLTVTDDGAGGADPDAGTGLYGLWDRVDAVDGALTVHSPAGGGTVLTADIPWEA